MDRRAWVFRPNIPNPRRCVFTLSYSEFFTAALSAHTFSYQFAAMAAGFTNLSEQAADGQAETPAARHTAAANAPYPPPSAVNPADGTPARR